MPRDKYNSDKPQQSSILLSPLDVRVKSSKAPKAHRSSPMGVPVDLPCLGRSTRSAAEMVLPRLNQSRDIS